jgi:DNA-directed RNA polymerase subunit K/omega
MTVFNVTITEASHLAGITAARVKYNENLSETITDEEGNEIPNPALIETDEDYVQFVMSKAAESYSNQYGT